MDDSFVYRVPLSREVRVKDLLLGGPHPVAVQSMANTDTADVEASTDQLLRIREAGAKMVRFTTQGMKEVEALGEVITLAAGRGCQVPVVADVHFRAAVALKAAEICHKVRINPGNFTESSRQKTEYSEEEFLEGLEKNKQQLLDLIARCRKHGTSLRIGVNHGSLSSRLMSRYGDTPWGMVASAMEFLTICHEADFHHVVVSLKSSNTRLMVQSVRLMVSKMLEAGFYYPLHLGVTESGDGLEGRIKSVVGIAPLLMEGMGDTIRVSLTEAPENEIPVAEYITRSFRKPESLPYNPLENLPWNPFVYNKPETNPFLGVGGINPPAVFSNFAHYTDPVPDFLIVENEKGTGLKFGDTLLVPQPYSVNETRSEFIISDTESDPQQLALIPGHHIIILDEPLAPVTDIKAWLIKYFEADGRHPVVLKRTYTETDREKYSLQAAGEYGLLLIDGLLDGIWINNPHETDEFNNWLSFYILQASRNRISSTEYIACPSCGRTLFDIEAVLKAVRKETSHLKGLKIAVMGCIVNGPGEMADADYGYVGSAAGKVTLYKGKTAVKKNIPQEHALEELLNLIRENEK